MNEPYISGVTNRSSGIKALAPASTTCFAVVSGRPLLKVLILTGVMDLLADTLCVLRINYRSKICLQLCGITEPISLRDMEIAPTMGKRTTGLTLAMSTNLLTNESYTDSCT